MRFASNRGAGTRQQPGRFRQLTGLEQRFEKAFVAINTGGIFFNRLAGGGRAGIGVAGNQFSARKPAVDLLGSVGALGGFGEKIDSLVGLMGAQKMLGQAQNESFVGRIGEGGIVKLLEGFVSGVVELIADTGGVMGEGIRIAGRQAVRVVRVGLR